MENGNGSIRHVFICGAKSIGQYGGYETFVDKLTEYQQYNPHVKIHILCKANGEGSMDETRLESAVQTGSGEFEYHGAHCVKLSVPRIGPAVAVYYDRKAVMYCIQYCRKYGINHPVIYILTCRIGPFIRSLKRKIKAIDGELHVNPDGHEWMRKKWAPPIRKYWKLSEKLMVKYADLLICDSINIEKYIQAEYRKYDPHTTYIAYGADLRPSSLSDQDPRYVSWMNAKNLKPQEYYLVVGRFVPENNYEIMIREFMRSKSTRDFAIITNLNERFQQELEEKLHFRSDPRIKFVGTVYDPDLLKKIRENAYAYFHGHEVGGTNPSLLEALGATKVNLLLNVGFNREVAEDAALYWSKEEGNLASLIEEADRLAPEERQRLGAAAQKRIQDNYSWQYISDCYGKIWNPD